jgi:hypothetical protein
MRRALSTMEAKLVENHMRIAFSVPAHREYVHTGAPSEPVLVEAAARITHRNIPRRLDIPSRIQSFIEEGIIDKPERGEIVSRLILLEAMDSAVLADQTGVSWNHRVFAKPIPLATYLVHLFGPKHAETILDSTPANISNGPDRQKLRLAFKGAQVYFTHFARATDSSVVTASAAWMGMSRGIAWQCSRTQEGIDICIPVLLNPTRKDAGTKLGEGTVVPLLIQVQNRNAKSRSIIDAESLGFFPSSIVDKGKRLYIALTMHLGAAETYPVSPRPGPSTPPGGRRCTSNWRLLHLRLWRRHRLSLLTASSSTSEPQTVDSGE